MKMLSVAGARPNFIKIAPLLREMARYPSIASILVHTGQHYDEAMSARFFAELDIPRPDFNLGVGSGSHAVQTAEVMRRLEPILESVRPDVTVVVGDVNSTLAAALTAAKLNVRVAHVEAGLRSFDRMMPEEINRRLTDAVSDFLFVTEESGRVNLGREGVPSERIHLVGNIVIDALLASRPRWEVSPVFSRLGIDPRRPYAVLTLHRPSNVDDANILRGLLKGLRDLATRIPIVFPVHPRAQATLDGGGGVGWLSGAAAVVPREGVVCVDPLGYFDFIALMSRATLVLTDSGGIQEETTILGVPCLTLRENTERPITVTHGTNRVVGTDPGRIVEEATRLLWQPRRWRPAPPLWDGRTAERVVSVLLRETQDAPTRA